MCDCLSYNQPHEDQKTEAVGLVPFWDKNAVISVDACIAPVIKHLWEKEIMTLGSCCGHNKTLPSIVVFDNLDKEDARKIREIISEVDGRTWSILSWVLTPF